MIVEHRIQLTITVTEDVVELDKRIQDIAKQLEELQQELPFIKIENYESVIKPGFS